MAPLGRPDPSRWACAAGHSFDVSREGYVNLLLTRGRKSRAPGDDAEMVRARRRFLSTGAYDPLTTALAAMVGAGGGEVVVDVGCGEGHHTRALAAPMVLGVDVAKPAVGAAARAHPSGWYAVASAADLPLDDASVDTVVDVFGPIFAGELARVVRPGGIVVTAHPGPRHLVELRALVYDRVQLHEVKPPLRHDPDRFEQLSSEPLHWELTVAGPAALGDLFAMTPYRWHGPPDIDHRIETAGAGGFVATAEVQLTCYRRR